MQNLFLIARMVASLGNLTYVGNKILIPRLFKIQHH